MKILVPIDSYPERYWLSYDHKNSIDHLKFLECSPVSPNEGLTKLGLKKKVSLKDFRKFDYLFSDGPDVVSSRIADLISSSGFASNVQFVSCELAISGDVYLDYFVINYLVSEVAFDMDRSQYKPLIKSVPDGPKKFQHIVLKDRKPNSGIFRSAESNSHVVVSDEVAEFFKSNSVVGVEFVSEKDGI